MPTESEIAAAVAHLRAGGAVAVPTDTQYALAVLASHGGGVMRCFALKERPDSDPLPILLPGIDWLARVADLSGPAGRLARALAEAAWPGALTLILPRNKAWRSLAAPGPTVAVRIPAHPVAQAVLAAIAAPITGTSANRHGDPPALTPDAVRKTFGDAVLILSPGDLPPAGAASTILDCTQAAPRIVRSGALEPGEIEALIARAHALQST